MREGPQRVPQHQPLRAHAETTAGDALPVTKGTLTAMPLSFDVAGRSARLMNQHTPTPPPPGEITVECQGSLPAECNTSCDTSANFYQRLSTSVSLA